MQVHRNLGMASVSQPNKVSEENTEKIALVSTNNKIQWMFKGNNITFLLGNYVSTSAMMLASRRWHVVFKPVTSYYMKPILLAALEAPQFNRVLTEADNKKTSTEKLTQLVAYAKKHMTSDQYLDIKLKYPDIASQHPGLALSLATDFFRLLDQVIISTKQAQKDLAKAKRSVFLVGLLAALTCMKKVELSKLSLPHTSLLMLRMYAFVQLGLNIQKLMSLTVSPRLTKGFINSELNKLQVGFVGQMLAIKVEQLVHRNLFPVFTVSLKRNPDGIKAMGIFQLVLASFMSMQLTNLCRVCR